MIIPRIDRRASGWIDDQRAMGEHWIKKHSAIASMNGIFLLLLFLFGVAIALTFYITSASLLVAGVLIVILIAFAGSAWYLMRQHHEEREWKARRRRAQKPHSEEEWQAYLQENQHDCRLHLLPIQWIVGWGFILVLIAIALTISPTLTSSITALPASEQLILAFLFLSCIIVSLYALWLSGGNELYERYVNKRRGRTGSSHHRRREEENVVGVSETKQEPLKKQQLEKDDGAPEEGDGKPQAEMTTMDMLRDRGAEEEEEDGDEGDAGGGKVDEVKV